MVLNGFNEMPQYESLDYYCEVPCKPCKPKTG